MSLFPVFSHIPSERHRKKVLALFLMIKQVLVLQKIMPRCFSLFRFHSCQQHITYIINRDSKIRQYIFISNKYDEIRFFQYNVNFTPITSLSYLAYVLLGKVIAMLLMIWWYIRRPYAAAMQTRHTKLLVLKRLLWAFFLGYCQQYAKPCIRSI